MDRMQKAALEKMSEAVYRTVGERLVKESQAQQKDINKKLIDRLDLWDKDVLDRIDELIAEKVVPMIQKLVKLEVNKTK